MALNWEAEPSCDIGSGRVGTVELMPNFIFTIEIWGERAGLEIGRGYLIKCEPFGGYSSKAFKTRAEVEAYLKGQMDKVPEYEELKAKRNAINGRIFPLQTKRDNITKQILNLLK